MAQRLDSCLNTRSLTMRQPVYETNTNCVVLNGFHKSYIFYRFHRDQCIKFGSKQRGFRL